MPSVFAHPGVTPVTLPLADPSEPEGSCLHAAVLITPDGHRIWFPCRSHEDGLHHFAAYWAACPAPWCRLPASHAIEGTMHDIPFGTVEYHDHIGVKASV